MRTGISPAGPGIVRSTTLGSSIGLGTGGVPRARSSSGVFPLNVKPMSRMRSMTTWA